MFKNLLPYICDIIYLLEGFELTYRDSGNTIHFSFFTKQFFPTSLEIAIPKHDKKSRKILFLNRETKLKTYFVATIRNNFNINVSCFNSFVVPAYTRGGSRTVATSKLERFVITNYSYLKKRHTFLNRQHFYKQPQAEIGKKLSKS